VGPASRGVGTVALLTVLGSAACGDDGDVADPPSGSVDLAGDDVGSAVLAGLGPDADDVDLAELRGTPVVVNFWASTCAPCVREMPALESVHQAAGDDVAFVGAAVNDRVDDALELADRTGVTYPLVADADGSFFVDAGATLLPTTLVLDQDGAVVRRLVGELTAEELVEVLADETGVEVALP
jgi:cytochrome c biogenesis protein CcmG/thiol:disulfide interchange protein DsbE